MDPFQVLAQLPAFFAKYEEVTAELIAVKRELAAREEEQYVTWEWVCEFFGIDRKTARLMLQNEKLFVYGRQIKRFKKSEILRFAERNSVKLKDIPA